MRASLTFVAAALASLMLAQSVADDRRAADSAPSKPSSRDDEAATTARQGSPRVLAVVNGEAITQADLEFMKLSRQVAADAPPEAEARLIERLIDRRLIRGFLKSRKSDVDPQLLDDAVGRIHRQIRGAGGDPDKVLPGLGFDDARLRDELALELAWLSHVRRVVTADQMRKYFEAHREELDGTEVRASQILLKLPADAEPAREREAKEKLARIRAEIAAGRLDFAAAARQFSEAASRNAGGDVGFFPYQGRMPVEFTTAAFGLRVGELSQPFRTSFGVHLCTVTARRPGQLSLEDARPEILRRLSNELWEQTVSAERRRAKIEMPASSRN